MFLTYSFSLFSRGILNPLIYLLLWVVPVSPFILLLNLFFIHFALTVFFSRTLLTGGLFFFICCYGLTTGTPSFSFNILFLLFFLLKSDSPLTLTGWNGVAFFLLFNRRSISRQPLDQPVFLNQSLIKSNNILFEFRNFSIIYISSIWISSITGFRDRFFYNFRFFFAAGLASSLPGFPFLWFSLLQELLVLLLFLFFTWVVSLAIASSSILPTIWRSIFDLDFFSSTWL